MLKIFPVLCLLLCFTIPAAAQVGPPINLDLGLGGGVSLPTGTMSDVYKTGYHAGGKVRLHGTIPFNIVLSGFYNGLPEKNDDKTDSWTLIGGGLEFKVPSAGVHPYFGADLLYVHFQNEGTGTSSLNRGGLGIGAGLEFTIPAFGSFDTSVKYQFLNIMGKDDGEETMSQIAGTLIVMFSLI